MAWAKDILSDVRVRSTKPSGSIRKLADGKGLQLWIMPHGGKYWRYEYRYQGKRKLLALGVYPDVSLSKARERATKARSEVADGFDPSAIKKQAKAAGLAFADNTFGAIVTKLVARKRKEGKAAVTISKFEWIAGKLKSNLGPRPIAEIKAPEIIKVLSAIEETGNLETAKRTRILIGAAFRYAIQHGLTEVDPVPATRGAIAAPKAKHFSAIVDPVKVGEMLRRINTYAVDHQVTGAALQLMALLYPRPGELRQAQWAEFDLEAATWQIPASRMKMRQAHAKPLPSQAVEVLRKLKEITGPDGNVFPGAGKKAKFMSENTMGAALKRMGISANQHSAHGFRATASTLLNAANMFSSDSIEHSLAHKDKDAVRRAYARGDAMNERLKMAQWWADYLDKITAGETAKVLPMKRKS